MKVLLTLLAVLVGMSGAAQAASFNCSYAKLPTEVLICQDEGLSYLDERNAAVYYTLYGSAVPAARPTIAKLERNWLARRNACGYDRDCVLVEYAAHIADLCEIAENAGIGASACELEGE